MKKVLIILALALSMGACSSLKEMGGKHKEARQELRQEQKAEKKNLGNEHLAEVKALNDKYMDDIEKAKATLKAIREQKKAEKKELGKEHLEEAKKLKLRLKAERELLSAKNALEFAVYGTRKHAELKFIIAELEEFLK